MQCKVTMSHDVQSTLLHKTLFGSGYCSVRRKHSVRDIHPAAPGRKNNRLLFCHPDEYRQRYQSAINEGIKFTSLESILRNCFRCAKFRVQIHAKMYL